MTDKSKFVFDSYYKCRDYFRDKLADRLAKGKSPILDSWKLEIFFMKIWLLIPSEHPYWVHEGKDCKHCEVKRH